MRPARRGRPRAPPPPRPHSPPEVVVTADREPEPISRTGSSISVVKGETLATSNPGSLVDVLRTVPGLDVSESGGPGSTTNIRLRGANTGQTLVMIDGIRINDPTAASGDFDFAMFAPSAIERIEVLKGPQSALYGSDAMGGVVNIITKKGSGPAQFNVRTEGGSYGTAVTNGSVIGSSGPWSYAVTGGGQHSNGFSRFGYRIPPLEAKFGPLERDGFDRLGGSARFGYDAGEGVRLETGMLSSFTRSAYDQSTGTFPDTPSSATRLLQQVWGRASVDTFGGILTHSLNVFDTHIDRSFNDVTYRINKLPQNTTSIISDFIGNSTGAEYQGNLKLGAAGSLIVGTRTQHETANTYSTNCCRSPARDRAAWKGARHQFGVCAVAVADRRAAEHHPRRPGRRRGRRRALRDVARDGSLHDCRDRHKIPRQRRHRRQGADAVSALRSGQRHRRASSPSRASATTPASINRCSMAA